MFIEFLKNHYKELKDDDIIRRKKWLIRIIIRKKRIVRSKQKTMLNMLKVYSRLEKFIIIKKSSCKKQSKLNIMSKIVIYNLLNMLLQIAYK